MDLVHLVLAFHGVQNLLGLAAFLLAGVVYITTLKD
jgi:uncharacterized membrane protein YhhN